MFGFERIGTTEIVVVAVVLLVIFGPKKLPELAKGITQAIKEISSVMKGEEKKATKKKD